MFKNPIFWAITIFIAAAVFRLAALDLIEFKLDEARDVYEMEKFWQSPTLLERGTIQSTGVYNPPLWYYILGVISAPSRDPQYLSFVIALINCAAVAGFYLVVKRFFGQGIGMGAGLLLAFSPWAILFSRKIWAPDMILPLLVPFLYCLFKIVIPAKAGIQLKKWAWFGLVLSLSLLAQLHASGIFLSLTTVIVLIITHLRGEKMRLHLGGVMLGLFLGLIPLLPYINYQIKTGCEDCRNYSAYQEGEAVVQPIFDGNAFLRPFQFINGSGFDNTLGDEGFRDFKEKYPLVSYINFIFLLEFLLLPVGIFSMFKLSRLSFLSLLSYLILIPTLYFITKTPSHLYYLLIISPITILIYTLGAFHLGKLHKWIPAFAGMTVVIINIIFELMFYNYLSEVKIVPGDYGQIYSLQKQQAAEKGMKVEEYTIRLFNSY